MLKESIDKIFAERTCYKFLPQEIPDQLLQEIYDVMKLGPTSANCCPLRIAFVKSSPEKEKLYSCLSPTNIDKVKSAPITAIFAYDIKFYERLDKLSPHNPNMKDYFLSSHEITLETAFRNSTLQAAYFMIIARSRGLDCGPMSGFNEMEATKVFFPNSSYRANFLCNLGYKEGNNPYPRAPRLDFAEVCEII